MALTPARSRARRSTPAGVRSGTIVALSAALLGTRIVPLPRANTVYMRPWLATVPSTVAPSVPPCRRTRSPTRNGREAWSITPAITLPSVL